MTSPVGVCCAAAPVELSTRHTLLLAATHYQGNVITNSLQVCFVDERVCGPSDGPNCLTSAVSRTGPKSTSHARLLSSKSFFFPSLSNFPLWRAGKPAYCLQLFLHVEKYVPDRGSSECSGLFDQLSRSYFVWLWCQ